MVFETPEEALIAREMSEAIEAAIVALPPRERAIVRMRFFIERPITLKTLGFLFGISRDRIRQLEHRAVRRLRKSLHRQMNTRCCRPGQ